MPRKANSNKSTERDASQQQDGSQGVSVLSSISLNRKMQAVSKLGHSVQHDLRLLHDRAQAAHVADAKNEREAVETAMAQAGAAAERAQADCADDSARSAEEERGHIVIINARMNKAVRRCEAEKVAAAERMTKSCAEANQSAA